MSASPSSNTSAPFTPSSSTLSSHQRWNLVVDSVLSRGLTTAIIAAPISCLLFRNYKIHSSPRIFQLFYSFSLFMCCFLVSGRSGFRLTFTSLAVGFSVGRAFSEGQYFLTGKIESLALAQSPEALISKSAQSFKELTGTEASFDAIKKAFNGLLPEAANKNNEKQ
jgi:hypothetical protein